MSLITYTGTLRNGKVELPFLLDLPEGSEVYVIAKTEIEKQTAKKKANGWLVDHVGNLVMAGDGLLMQHEDKWIWRFHAYLTSLSHEPYGPIGHVDVDAHSGMILSNQQTVESMYNYGEQFIHSA
jgi:hypothetical protein